MTAPAHAAGSVQVRVLTPRTNTSGSSATIYFTWAGASGKCTPLDAVDIWGSITAAL